jgi:hypothetical protein
MSDHVDAAINFAITAWHMTDWVWVQHEDKLREHFHMNCRREFQDEMRRLCPGLAVCDVIANAAKHGGVAHDRKDRPGIETVLIAHPVGDGAGGAEVVAVLDERRWSLIIEVDGAPQTHEQSSIKYFSFGTDLYSNTASLIRCPNMLNIEDSGVPKYSCVSHKLTDIDEQLHGGAGRDNRRRPRCAEACELPWIHAADRSGDSGRSAPETRLSGWFPTRAGHGDRQ